MIEIGDLVVVSVAAYKVRSHIFASPTQNITTMQRSTRGLFWFYRDSTKDSNSNHLSAIVVDSCSLCDGRELFICFFPFGELKPFEAHELTLIQKGNETT